MKGENRPPQKLQKVLKTGELLSDRYEVQRVLGQGGMGAVYLVKDTRIPTFWAVKEMAEQAPSGQETRELVEENFKAEARILSSLNHPNLPRITDFFSQDGRQYLVMDFIEGRTLEEVLEESKTLGVDETLDLALQITEVLEYLHTRQPPIIFRDFKPGNVMLTPDGRVKLIDFGIARFFREGATTDTKALGTPGYAAPEQYGKGQSDARTDVYALGATVYQCLSGKDPTHEPFVFPPFREQRAEVPEGLEKIVLQSVELNPADRFQSAADFGKALEALKEDPAAYQHLPARLKTAPLAPPKPAGFDPPVVRLGPVARGAVARQEVVLRGDFTSKLRPDRRWLRVTPDKAEGKDCRLTVAVSTASMVDGGTFSGQIKVKDAPDVDPLRVEVSVEPSHVSFWSLTLAFMFCMGSFVPLLGYLTTGLLLMMFLSTPRGERALLKLFLVVAIMCSIGWTLVGGLVGFGLTRVNWDWERLPIPWSQPADPSPTPAAGRGMLPENMAWLPANPPERGVDRHDLS